MTEIRVFSIGNRDFVSRVERTLPIVVQERSMDSSAASETVSEDLHPKETVVTKVSKPESTLTIRSKIGLISSACKVFISLLITITVC